MPLEVLNAVVVGGDHIDRLLPESKDVLIRRQHELGLQCAPAIDEVISSFRVIRTRNPPDDQ